MSVDRALRRHACQHNATHVILKGDVRLKVATGRSHEHYCVMCATKFVNQAVERLHALEGELGSSEVGGRS